MNIIEKAAVWYLKRRGRIVLPRVWIGMALGFGTAHSIEPFEKDKASVWTVTLPPGSNLYAVNHSVLDGSGTHSQFSFSNQTVLFSGDKSAAERAL